MFRRNSLSYRFGLPVIGSMIVFAGLMALNIDSAKPSGAQAPSFQVLPPGPTFNDPVAVSSDGTHVWVANKRGDSVSEIDAATGAVIQVIAGPSYDFDGPDAISAHGTDVWVANGAGNDVTELDASTGALVRVIGTPATTPSEEWSPTGEFDYPTAISSDGTHVWVVNNNQEGYTVGRNVTYPWSIAELDASTGALVQLMPGATNATTAAWLDISSDGTHVWVSNSGYWIGPTLDQTRVSGSVTELDASTGAVVGVIQGSANSLEVPFALSSDGTNVWVADGGEAVDQIDAATGAVVQVIPSSTIGIQVPFDISTDGTHVWVVGNANTVAELSASTGALVQEVPASSAIDYQTDQIVSDGTHVWDLNTDGNALTELDASTGAVVQTIAGNSDGFNDPVAVSSDGTHVWAMNIGSNSVTELDAATGARVQVISGPTYDFDFGTDLAGEPEAIDSDGTHVWVANADGNSVTELYAATGAVVQVISGHFSEPVAVSSDGTHVWVGNFGNNSVTELDAATGGLVKVFSGSKYAFDDPFAISSDGTHVWVPNSTGDSVTELDAATGAVVRVITGLTGPVVATSDGIHVWLLGSYFVTELNAATGAVVQVISGSSYVGWPDAVSSDGTDVWIAGAGTNTVAELDASTGALVQVLSGSTYGLELAQLHLCRRHPRLGGERVRQLGHRPQHRRHDAGHHVHLLAAHQRSRRRACVHRVGKRRCVGQPGHVLDRPLGHLGLLDLGRHGELPRHRDVHHRRQPGRRQRVCGGSAGHPILRGWWPGHHLHLHAAHQRSRRRACVHRVGKRRSVGQPGHVLDRPLGHLGLLDLGRHRHAHWRGHLHRRRRPGGR